MPDDAELLRRYAEGKSEAAFTELVQRNLGLVYAAALRQLGGDTHHAQDVAQTVFTTLARNAGSVARHPILIGWLYTTTQHFAAKVRRAEGRRSAREHAAHLMHALTSPDSPAAEWEQLRPILDDAMRDLSDRDREAVLLRFFAQRPFAEIGAMLHLSEDAARMRVDRALEKLRALLAKHQITSTTAALALALAHQPAVALPAGFAAGVASSALTSIGTVTTPAVSVFQIMSTIQVAPGVAMIAALVAVGVAIHNVREAHLTETAFATVVRENAVAAARLRGLSQRVETDARQTATLQKAAAERSSPASVASPAPAPPSDDAALQAGRELLASHPEARRVLDRIVRSFVESSYGTKLRLLGLSPEEFERVIADGAQGFEQGRISIPGASFEFGTPNSGLWSEAWQRELGLENFLRFSELRRKDRTNGIVKTVAMATYESDTPLLPAQIQALSDIIEHHTTLQKTEATRMIFAVDWAAIGKAAGGVLSAPQTALFHAALQQGAPATITQDIPSR